MCFFVSVFSESITGFIKAPFPFSRRSFLCSSSLLHLKRRMEYAVRKYPFSRRGLPRPQVAVEERNGIHPFGMSRKGGVLRLQQSKIQIMTHYTAWILAILLCIVLAQLPTSTTSEYTQPKYNAVPKEVIGAIFYSSDWMSEHI